jgi:hypothetical protein
MELRKMELKRCDLGRYSCTQKFSQHGERVGRVLPIGQEVLIGELEKAQRRTCLELEEWTLQAELVSETAHGARILEIAAECEAHLAQIERDAVQAQVDQSFNLRDTSVGALTTPSTVTEIRLQACCERYLGACLRLQICRRHRQLCENSLEQLSAALARTKQRYAYIAGKIATLRTAMEQKEVFMQSASRATIRAWQGRPSS